MNKLITVIMPVKNGENYMKEAVKSIQNQGVDVELIVVNDASCDNTEKIAKELNCKVINHQKCLGQVAGKNTGLKASTGDYIMFCDHDDILAENAIKTMLAEFDKDKDLMVVNAKIKDFISPDCKNQNQTIKKEAYFGCLGGSMLIKKEVFDIIGLFDETIKAGEIIALSSNFSKYNIKIKKIDFVSSKRRIHDFNYGKMAKKSEFKDYISMLRIRLKDMGGGGLEALLHFSILSPN